MFMIVALAQMDLAWEDFNTNINRFEIFTKEASLKNIELILFTEIFQIASKEAHVITVGANWPQNRENHWI